MKLTSFIAAAAFAPLCVFAADNEFVLTIKEHHFTCTRQVGNISLEIPLGFFTVTGRRKSHHATDSWIKTLHHALDGSPFTGGISSLKNDHHFLAGRGDPIL